MNISNIIFANYTTYTLTIRRSTAEPFVKNPFDSWYIGGILFMSTVMFVLLYANYYRENMFEHCWLLLLTKLRFIQRPPTLSAASSFPSPIHRGTEPILV